MTRVAGGGRMREEDMGEEGGSPYWLSLPLLSTLLLCHSPDAPIGENSFLDSL